MNLGTNSSDPGWTGGRRLLADVGSFQMEYRALSWLTGNPRWQETGDRVFDMIVAAGGERVLLPCMLDALNPPSESSVFLLRPFVALLFFLSDFT